jgi:GH24 family phage-related lysozyme (muramidase)
MQISARGLKLIADFEGLRLNAYPDPGTGNEPWTIGYGTTVYPNGDKVKKGDVISPEQALDYLRHDSKKFSDAVNRAVRVPVNQNQFDALVSFTYNLGEGALNRSTLLTKINSHDYRGAANEFGKWIYAGNRILAGLVRRRTAERDLFLAPVAAEPTPTPPEPPVAADPVQPEKPKKGFMAPVLAALLPSLVSLIPELAKFFGGGPKTQQNIALAEKVANIVVGATGAPNLQGAVELMQTDPQVLSVAKKAVQEVWFELAEAGGGGIEGARKFNVEVTTPFWKMPAFWITVLLLPLLYGTVYLVLTGTADSFSGELRAAIASAVVTGVLGATVGFWLGSSFTTSKSRGLGAEPTQ